MKKRILAVILTLVMLLGMVPVSALAAEDTPTAEDPAILGVTLDQTGTMALFLHLKICLLFLIILILQKK